MGVRGDEVALQFALDSGKARLFLDGLDEVNREYIISLKSEIINLSASHRNISLIITSRPGALLDHLYEIPDFFIFEIAKLDIGDYLEFLKKIGTPAESAENLVSAINRPENGKVKNVVETPLMLTLLVMVYGCKTVIPNNLPDFYKEMFHVLSHLHDESKPGYVRQWATSLNPAEINKIFEAFCYSSMELASNSLTQDQFAESHSVAKDISGIECTPQGLRTDLVESVCLMAKDGLNTTFIHKSVQEFFCAFFISHCKDDEFVEQFYQSFDNMQRIIRFDQTLEFLEQIDSDRFSRYYLQYWWKTLSLSYDLDDSDGLMDQFIDEVNALTHLKIDNPLKMRIFEIMLSHSKLLKPDESELNEPESRGGKRVSFSIKFNRKKAISGVNQYLKGVKNLMAHEEKSKEKKHATLINMLRKNA